MKKMTIFLAGTNDNARNNRKTGAVIVEPKVEACGDK